MIYQDDSVDNWGFQRWITMGMYRFLYIGVK